MICGAVRKKEKKKWYVVSIKMNKIAYRGKFATIEKMISYSSQLLFINGEAYIHLQREFYYNWKAN